MNQQIAEKAEQLWRQAGQPQGRDDEFWLAAERELDAAAQEEKHRFGFFRIPNEFHIKGNLEIYG
jgi:hypothetical protein